MAPSDTQVAICAGLGVSVPCNFARFGAVPYMIRMATQSSSPLATIPKALTAVDVEILGDIISEAEAAASATGSSVQNTTLVHILDAYDNVLRKHGIFPSDDTFYYRCLLKLSLDTSAPWHARLARVQEVGQCVTTEHSCSNLFDYAGDGCNEAKAEPLFPRAQ